MKRVYIDTTIPSFLFDKRPEPEMIARQKWTKVWWAESRSNYNIFVSNEVIAELERGDYPKKKEIVDFTKKIPRLEFNEEIVRIAEIYMKEHLMPIDYIGDAVHLAYASFYKIDFLLTWNCNHLANSNKKAHIIALNNRLRLFVPELTTPMELMDEEFLI